VILSPASQGNINKLSLEYKISFGTSNYEFINKCISHTASTPQLTEHASFTYQDWMGLYTPATRAFIIMTAGGSQGGERV